MKHWSRFVTATGTNATFSPGSCHQPGPKASFQQPKGREAAAFGPGWWHQLGLKGGHWSRFVAPTGTNAPLQSRLVPPTGTNGPCTTAWWWEFSPTSLAEREPHLFIRCDAPTLSSSSLKQAFRPNLSLCACGPAGPSTGLNPGPW